jgi:hypothetical protein
VSCLHPVRAALWRATQKTSTPPRLSGRARTSPHRARIATLLAQESAPNRHRKAPLIGLGSGRGSELRSAAPHPQESGMDRHPETARPRHTPARPQRRKPQLKKNPPTSAPRQPEHLPDAHPLPDRSPWPPTNANSGHSARRSGSWAIVFSWERESGFADGCSRSSDQQSQSVPSASQRNENSEALAERWDEARTRSR